MIYLNFLAFILLLSRGCHGNYEDRYEEILETDEPCSKGRGRIIQIGIVKKIFEPKIEVCFNFKSYKTYFTMHYIKKHGQSGDPGIATSWSKEFFEKADPSKFYKNLPFPTDKGHLSPRGDFNTDTERKMTFFYINCAPQAASLNRGSWRALEEWVRVQAYKQKKPVKIITGTGGKLFTIDKKLGYDYPEYFFKLVIFNQKRILVFIGMNDLKRTKPIDGLCSVISSCGWSNPRGGTVYCCKFNKNVLAKLGVDDYRIRNYKYNSGIDWADWILNFYFP